MQEPTRKQFHSLTENIDSLNFYKLSVDPNTFIQYVFFNLNGEEYKIKLDWLSKDQYLHYKDWYIDYVIKNTSIKGGCYMSQREAFKQ